MATNRITKENRQLTTLLAVVAVLTLLYVAREVLIPLALAVLLSFLLAPLCDRLERWKFGRIGSVLVVSALSFVLLGAIAWTVMGQFIDLASQIPQYQHNIRAKLQALQLPGAGPISRATESIRELTQEMLATPPTADPTEPPPEDAVPVQIVEGPFKPMEAVLETIEPFWNPVVSAGIVIVFVIFILLQREDLRDRVLRLIGQGRMTVATQAFDDAAKRVSRFLLMQLIINATYGLAIGIGLFFIGVPNSVLWGVIATLVRFIPYVGPWIGALLPITLAMAAFQSWQPVLLTIGLFVVIELLSNNVMEPWLYGARTGISPVAILVSALFWAWLWGPVGLVLATPLTVCVVVMGRYISRLEFLSVLLSDEPGLTPSARLYQRLLVMDADDVCEIAEDYLSKHSLLELYDDILLPAIQLAERDRHRGKLDEDHERALYSIIRDLLDDLSDRITPPENGTAEHARKILLVPARDEADEISCVMLSHLLRQNAIVTKVRSSKDLVAELLTEANEFKPNVLALCAVPPQGITRLRLLCKRFSMHSTNLNVVVGYWNTSDLENVRTKVKTCKPDRVVSNFADALAILRG